MTSAAVRRPFISRRNAATRSRESLASQKEHVVLDMLKIVGRHGQETSNHRRIGFRHALQALAFNKANGSVDDGFGCETMEIAIFEAEDIAGQVKRADLAATVR